MEKSCYGRLQQIIVSCSIKFVWNIPMTFLITTISYLSYMIMQDFACTIETRFLKRRFLVTYTPGFVLNLLPPTKPLYRTFPTSVKHQETY